MSQIEKYGNYLGNYATIFVLGSDQAFMMRAAKDALRAFQN